MSDDISKSADEPQTASVTLVSELVQSRSFQTRLNLNLEPLKIEETVVLTTLCSSDSNLSVAIVRSTDVQFRVTWTALDNQAPMRHARTVADLYWVDPTTNERVFIASTVGSHHDIWPTQSTRTLGIYFTVSDLEGIGRPDFDWKMCHEYFARFSFWSDRLPTDAPEEATVDNLTATRTVMSYSASSAPNDVRFLFRRVSDKKVLSVWSASAVLRQNCPYFETLLHSEFTESKLLSDANRTNHHEEEEAIQTDSEMDEASGESVATDGDSDYDLDDLEDNSNACSSPNPTLPYHRIQVVDFSYTTYRAVLVWIQTGYISFSPLLSSFSHLPSEARQAARIASIQSAHKLDSQLPLSASPKSVYKLAHLLSLPALESLALKELSRQLTTENVFYELFDGMASTYEEVRKLEVEFAVKNKREVIKTKGFKEVLEKLRQNELAFSGPVIADLLPLFVG